MTLYKKTLLIVGLTSLGLVAILHIISQAILLGSFTQLEEAYAHKSVERALNAVANKLAVLNATAGDWSAWDATYEFVQAGSEDYIIDNLSDAAFTNLGVNLFLFTNQAGELVYGKAVDLAEEQEVPLSAEVKARLLRPGLLLDHPHTESNMSGIVLLPEGPLLVVSRPVLTNERQGPIQGTLIMGRYLDAREIQLLAQGLQVQLAVQRLDAKQAVDSLPQAVDSLPQAVDSFPPVETMIQDPAVITVQPLSQDRVAGYAILNDLEGNPALALRVVLPRDIYRQGKVTLVYLILAVFAAGLVFGLAILALLQKQVLSRLVLISGSVERIGAGGETGKQVPVVGRDELTALAQAINSMLERLKQSRLELSRARDQLEVRVQERTVALARANQTLQAEVNERARAEETIRAALVEKDVLLKEIHHRVKNNLQVISSMLYLKAKKIQDTETQAMFRDSQSRIKSMALIHERLYQSDDLAKVDFSEYIHSLVYDLFQSYGTNPEAVKSDVRVEDVRMGIDTAIPCGLIVNELVSNSLKYAFPGDRSGTISIRLSPEGERQYRLIVQDDGVGIPKELDLAKTRSLGLQLVNRLVEQLDGSLELENGTGTTFTIHLCEIHS